MEVHPFATDSAGPSHMTTAREVIAHLVGTLKRKSSQQ